MVNLCTMVTNAKYKKLTKENWKKFSANLENKRS